MTHEGQGPRTEDTLMPPTSTRWSEESAGGEEDGLVAPFIPGQARPGHVADGGSPPQGAPGGAAAENEAGSFPGAAVPSEVEESGVPEPERVDVAEEPFPFDRPWAEDAGSVDDEPVGEGDFPPDAFAREPEAEASGRVGAGGAAPAVRRTAEDEVAERLERLASRLRSEGVEGVERELASSDRLTSLLAALLAGHLASR